jgi:hypothetical protein
MLLKQAEEIIKCGKSFPYFCKQYAKMTHPLKGLIPMELEAWQLRLADALEDNRFVISTKWRQSGISTTTLMYCLWLCMFRENQKILWVCKTLAEAEDVGRTLALVINFLPRWMQPRMERNNKREKTFASTGSDILFHCPQAARGRAVTHLVIDEAAYIPNMEFHWKCMWPCLSTGGKCFIQSTVNRGGDGLWFSELYLGAMKNTNCFHVFTSNYKEHPIYQDDSYVKGVKEALGSEGWSIEMEQELFHGLKCGEITEAGPSPTETT